jgi:hypothetical protein
VGCGWLSCLGFEISRRLERPRIAWEGVPPSDGPHGLVLPVCAGRVATALTRCVKKGLLDTVPTQVRLLHLAQLHHHHHRLAVCSALSSFLLIKSLTGR